MVFYDRLESGVIKSQERHKPQSCLANISFSLLFNIFYIFIKVPIVGLNVSYKRLRTCGRERDFLVTATENK